MDVDIDLITQIKLHKEISKKIEELEDQRRSLGHSILQQMTGRTLQAPGYVVRRCSRISIKVPLELARMLHAIKLEETVDREKIKSLYNSGQSIEGVSEIQYIQISDKAKDL